MSGPLENLTLSDAELGACRPISRDGGRVVRAYCPFHGSDHQRSLSVNTETGRFRCFACGAWGYIAEARERWAADHPGRSPARRPRPTRSPVAPQFPSPAARPPAPPQPARADLAALLLEYQAALPGSWGETYLHRRGIPLELAQACGVGYASAGRWAHPSRDWRWGRLVFPHADPGGRLLNLYGRAVGADEKVPKDQRHDHLPGAKGYFNAGALGAGSGPVFVCEGAFDALALRAAGYGRVVAIYGVDGWRWEWARGVDELVFALDADQAGGKWRELARQARMCGKRVGFLPPEAYGGHKDAAAAWAAGVLDVGSWPAGDPATADALPPIRPGCCALCDRPLRVLESFAVGLCLACQSPMQYRASLDGLGARHRAPAASRSAA